MNRGIIIVFPVVVAALVVTGVAIVRLQKADTERLLLSDKLAATENSAQELEAELNGVRQQLGEAQLAAADAEAIAREKIAGLEAKLVAAERQLANAGGLAGEDDWGELGAEAEPAVADKSEKKGFGAVIESMFKDESMKKMMRQSQRAMLERTYGHLFAKLGLSDDRLSQLKDLLVERQMAGTERGMDFLTVGEDKEKMAALIDDLKLQREAADAELKELLDPDEFAALQAYEETLGERMQVSQFAGAAQAAGEPLSAEQTESLIELMHVTNRDVFGDGFSQQNPTEAMRAMQSADGINDMLAKMDQANEKLIKRSGNVLTPGQQDAFVKHQRQQAQMQKVGMQMMQSMTSQEKDGDQAAE